MNKFETTLPKEKITWFCKKWKIKELEIFGSILRDDFNLDSDVDLIATSQTGVSWGLFDHINMQLELETILNRRVDLVTRQAVENSDNWIRRQEITKTAQKIYPFIL